MGSRGGDIMNNRVAIQDESITIKELEVLQKDVADFFREFEEDEV